MKPTEKVKGAYVLADWSKEGKTTSKSFHNTLGTAILSHADIGDARKPEMAQERHHKASKCR
ncbi:MAG: hypothetical protein QW468_04525 [Candidatus Bathyarchaeia archaeon]